MKKTLDQWLVFFVPISVSNFHFQFPFHFISCFSICPCKILNRNYVIPFIVSLLKLFCVLSLCLQQIITVIVHTKNCMLASSKWIHCFSLLSKTRCGLANNCNYEVIPVWIMYNTAFVIDTLGWGTVNKQKLLNSVDISLIFSFHPKPMGMHVGHLLGGQRSQI